VLALALAVGDCGVASRFTAARFPSPLPFIVISPSTPHIPSSAALNDYRALRVWERMLGVPCLNGARTAAGMGAPFRL